MLSVTSLWAPAGDAAQLSFYLRSGAMHTSLVPCTHLWCHAHICGAMHTALVPCTQLWCHAHSSGAMHKAQRAWSSAQGAQRVLSYMTHRGFSTLLLLPHPLSVTEIEGLLSCLKGCGLKSDWYIILNFDLKGCLEEYVCTGGSKLSSQI